MSQLDTNTEGFFESFIIGSKQLNEMPLMQGDYYVQILDADRYVLLHKDHPLMKMTDDEFVATLDDPFYDLVAEVTYNAAMG